MSTLQKHGRPRFDIALRFGPDRTELRIQVDWHGRISGPAAARLLIVLALVFTAAATLAHDELARGVLYGLAGLLTGARLATRS
jgi:hypothetical protein